VSSDFFLRDRNEGQLFSKYDLRSVIHQQEQRLIDEVNTCDKGYIQNTDIEIVGKSLKQKYELKPLILHENDIFVTDPIETKVDVSQDRNRAIFHRSSPVYMEGIALTYVVPFEGEEILLYCRASTYTMNPPAGKIENGEIRFTYYGVDPDPKAIKADFERRLKNVGEHIKYVNNDISKFNNQLSGKIRSLVNERKNRISKNRDIVNELGYKRKSTIVKDRAQESKKTHVSHGTKPARKKKAQTPQWDFFICHASEDKELVAIPIYQALAKQNYQVWLDKFTLKLGDRLRQKIDEGLRNSRYGIVILSPNFFAKRWPQEELDGLFALEQDGKKRILPVWHNIDYEDICKFSPILAGRLGVKTSAGMKIVVDKIIEASNE